MIFIGPISSIFDYATFAMMVFIFSGGTDPALFQTGWFVEPLLTQTLIIHITRTAKIPFIESQAGSALIATTIIICAIGIGLPFKWAGIGPWLYAATVAVWAIGRNFAAPLCRLDPSREELVCWTLRIVTEARRSIGRSGAD
jgi:P-type Mg2+ transporter